MFVSNTTSTTPVDNIDETLLVVRSFFNLSVASLLGCLGYFYISFDKDQPLRLLRKGVISDFLLVFRVYHLVGHTMTIFRCGNQFTHLSAVDGGGLLSDSVGFLVMGAMLYSSSAVAMGTFHFKQYLFLQGYGGAYMKTWVKQQMVKRSFWYFLGVIPDVVVQIYLLRRQLELNEVLNSSIQERESKKHQDGNPKKMRRASFAIKKHAAMGGSGCKLRQTLMILGAVVLWILQNTDSNHSIARHMEE